MCVHDIRMYVSVILLEGCVGPSRVCGAGPQHPGDHHMHDEATGKYRRDTHTHMVIHRVSRSNSTDWRV